MNDSFSFCFLLCLLNGGRQVLAQELMDEDQKVQDQQNQLVKLHQAVSRVQEECEAAEKVLASLNHDAAAVADQMQRLHHDVERNKQLYRETTASKQTSTARLSAIDDQRRLHKRHRLEIAQMLILIDTCRRIRNVNQTIETWPWIGARSQGQLSSIICTEWYHCNRNDTWDRPSLEESECQPDRWECPSTYVVLMEFASCWTEQYISTPF